jgi:23S rRNA (guanosine2251-2'-O)-methyltransferase
MTEKPRLSKKRSDSRKPSRSQASPRPLRDRHLSKAISPPTVALPLSPSNESEENSDLIYGLHTVLAVLESDRQLNRVWITARLRYDPRFHTLLNAVKTKGTVIDEVSIQRLNQLTDNGNHQGVAAQVAPYAYLDLSDLIERAKAQSPNPVIVILDSITDPYNFGAILRTAEAFGTQGIIVPQRRSVGVTSTVTKVASGALEHLPIARVVNLSRALETLKAEGFWIYGTVAETGKLIHKLELQGALGLVIGSEGEGLNLLTQRHCDELISIPLGGHTPSLNASVATAISLYEIYRQRWPEKLHLQ